MTTEQIFSICNTMVLPGWLLLIFFPAWKFTQHIITGIIITLLAITYAYFVFSNIKPSDLQSFSTLKGVMSLFTNETGVLAGWIHYLAFDLMTGLFIANNAMKHNVNRLLVVPCLLFCFMLGPVGLLLYFIIRAIKTRNYFAANY